MIAKTAQIILHAGKRDEVVVVVSAMKKVTDALIEIYEIIET
jgi:aspartokinase